MIKVVDIFAGPGGLGEGFSAVIDKRGESTFKLVLSIEKDRVASETLRLRTFFREFRDRVPDEYYDYLRGALDLNALYSAHPVEAKRSQQQCWNATLGPGGESVGSVRQKIREAVGRDESWVLIGGPPCQAYSLAGRSRNRGNKKYRPSKDVKQKLYLEYLQILAEHRPAVFVMENVKGLLSATLQNEKMYHRILEDLADPAFAIRREGRGTSFVRSGGYRIHPLIEPASTQAPNLNCSLIRAEAFGIPQARHRVILLGIRDDLAEECFGYLKPLGVPVPAARVLRGLPRLRSGLSPSRDDSPGAWKECLSDQLSRRWLKAGVAKVDSSELARFIRRKLGRLSLPKAGRGREYLRSDHIAVEYCPEWFLDDRINGVCNHSSRGHMPTDLFRYFYAACYAEYYGRSPTLAKFPADLRPQHTSASSAIEGGGNFADRFRVQMKSRPSTTVVSHISKDGHYYIHPDPLQCRSLTVREAARLQTFPDNYFFCGNRTSQYTQVGNAVPPLLARQIAEIVRDAMLQRS